MIVNPNNAGPYSIRRLLARVERQINALSLKHRHIQTHCVVFWQREVLGHIAICVVNTFKRRSKRIRDRSAVAIELDKY